MAFLIGGLEEIRCIFPDGKMKGAAGALPGGKRSTGAFYLDGSNLRSSTIKKVPTRRGRYLFYGGLEEIRTPDPRNANAMRSQLRYEPLFQGAK